MNTKKAMVAAVAAGFVIGLFAPVLSAAPRQAQQKQDKQAAAPAPQPRVIIPKPVKDVMEANLAARQTRADIPFAISKTHNLPARDGAYIYFFLNMKNADLGFAPNPQAPDKVKAVFDVFLQFYKADPGQQPQLVREVYCPTTIEEAAATLDPNKEEIYSVGYPLLPGAYLAALAVTTHDLKKIGLQYQEFSLPNPQSFTTQLDTTPLIFISEVKENQPVEVIPALHKGVFRYLTWELTMNKDNSLKVGDELESFFFIFGAQPNPQGKYDIECTYDVTKGTEPAIKFAPQAYVSPFIDQSLPMKQTLLTKTTDEKGVTSEKQSTQDLPAGTYTFSVKITDKTSGRTCAKSLDFTVIPSPAK
jgi:hypothetical protein